MSEKFGRGKARKSAVLLGFRGLLGLIFQNSFLVVFEAKLGKKGVLGPNFCKSLREGNANVYAFYIV